MENPNEYDDNAYGLALQELDNDLSEHVEALWNAGATITDIKLEIENLIQQTLVEIGALIATPHRGGGPKPKKPKS